jgi:hypothetical protein
MAKLVFGLLIGAAFSSLVWISALLVKEVWFLVGAVVFAFLVGLCVWISEEWDNP